MKKNFKIKEKGCWLKFAVLTAWRRCFLKPGFGRTDVAALRLLGPQRSGVLPHATRHHSEMKTVIIFFKELSQIFGGVLVMFVWWTQDDKVHCSQLHEDEHRWGGAAQLRWEAPQGGGIMTSGDQVRPSTITQSNLAPPVFHHRGFPLYPENAIATQKERQVDTLVTHVDSLRKNTTILSYN